MSPLGANVCKCPQDSPGGSHTGEKAADAPGQVGGCSCLYRIPS